jgi:hypothetical protein
MKDRKLNFFNMHESVYFLSQYNRKARTDPRTATDALM